MAAPEPKKSRLETADDSSIASDNTPNSGIIRFEVDKVSSLSRDGRYSPEVEVEGVPWRANVCKQIKDGQDALNIFLYGMENHSTLWSINVTATLLLLNADDSQNLTHEFEKQFDHSSEGWGGCMQTWAFVMDEQNGFVKNDKLTVEIRFTIVGMRGLRSSYQIDFTDANEPRHDVTLVLGGEKVYVSKQYLALHSPVFNAMFNGNFDEKNKKEIAMNDIDREEFLELLRVIYPTYIKITDDNIGFLVKLGDRFQIKLVLDLAETHLITSSKLELAPKLLLSDQYRLAKLQGHCLEQLKTQEDVKELKSLPEYDNLSETAKVALLEKMFRLVPE